MYSPTYGQHSKPKDTGHEFSWRDHNKVSNKHKHLTANVNNCTSPFMRCLYRDFIVYSPAKCSWVYPTK